MALIALAFFLSSSSGASSSSLLSFFSSSSASDGEAEFVSPAPRFLNLSLVNSAELKFDNIDGGVWRQGWPIEYDAASAWSAEAPLRVFVMPHSHVDAGWIRTFTEYYEKQARQIISSVVHALDADKRRHFLWADVGFLQRWWDDVDERERARCRRVVQRGQMELVTGAWVTSDEANPQYQEIVEQLLEGHEWLRVNLNVQPRYGWSIDPFGHSPTLAYLLKRSGFRATIINRVHYEMKRFLARRRSLEFKWRQEWQEREEAADEGLLTHIFPFYAYDVPHTCGPDPAVCCEFDFVRGSCPWKGHRPTPITEANVEQQALKLLDQYRKKSRLFRTRNVLVPLGDDFRYQTPTECSKMLDNYQLLFDYINAHRDTLHAEVRFANLTDYFAASEPQLLKSQSGGEEASGDSDAEAAAPTLVGDFFTYADRDDDYWSGYFTSRPFHKRLGRLTQQTARAAEIAHSLAHARLGAGMGEAGYTLSSIIEARRTMGVFQHHDAVTGTAKTVVMADYAQMLHSARWKMSQVLKDSLQTLLNLHLAEGAAEGDEQQELFSLEYTEREGAGANELPCVEAPVPMSSDSSGVRFIVAFNSEASARWMPVSVSVDHCSSGAETQQIFVTAPPGERIIPSQCQRDFFHATSKNSFRLHFLYYFDPLSLVTFKINSKNRVHDASSPSGVSMFASESAMQADWFHPHSPEQVERIDSSFTLGDEHFLINFNLDGLMARSTQRQMSSSAGADESYATMPTDSGGKSGAYLMHPSKGGMSRKLKPTSVVVLRGPVMDECVVRFDSLQLVRSLRIYKRSAATLQSASAAAAAVSASALFHSVDVRHRFALSPSQGSVEFLAQFRPWTVDEFGPTRDAAPWYSDLNGFQMQKRTKNPLIADGGNFYPVSTEARLFAAAGVEDGWSQFSVHTDHAVAASSLEAGSLVLVLDRQSTSDDVRGLGQKLNDNMLTESRFLLQWDAPATSYQQTSSVATFEASHIINRPLQMFQHHSRSRRESAQSMAVDLSLLNRPFPAFLSLDTLRVREHPQHIDDESQNESELIMMTRRLPVTESAEDTGDNDELTLDEPLFSNLRIDNSVQHGLSLSTVEEQYSHGDFICKEKWEIEAHVLQVSRATGGGNLAQWRSAMSQEKLVELKTADGDGKVAFGRPRKASAQEPVPAPVPEPGPKKGRGPSDFLAEQIAREEAEKNQQRSHSHWRNDDWTVVYIASALLGVQMLVAYTAVVTNQAKFRVAITGALFFLGSLSLQFALVTSMKHQ